MSSLCLGRMRSAKIHRVSRISSFKSGKVASKPGEDHCRISATRTAECYEASSRKAARWAHPHTSRRPAGAPTDADLSAGLKVSGILAAEYIRSKDGSLWTVIDGGWDWFQANSNPFRVPLPLLLQVDTGTILPGSMLDLKLVVRSPTAFKSMSKKRPLRSLNSLVRRSRIAVLLEFSGSQSGLWNVQVLAGHQVIGEFPIEIRLPAQA